jgi:hypothetical protein
MTQAQMIVAVITPRLADGGAVSPLTAGALAVIAARRGALSSAAVISPDAAPAARATAATKAGW